MRVDEGGPVAGLSPRRLFVARSGGARRTALRVRRSSQIGQARSRQIEQNRFRFLCGWLALVFHLNEVPEEHLPLGDLLDPQPQPGTWGGVASEQSSKVGRLDLEEGGEVFERACPLFSEPLSELCLARHRASPPRRLVWHVEFWEGKGCGHGASRWRPGVPSIYAQLAKNSSPRPVPPPPIFRYRPTMLRCRSA